MLSLKALFVVSNQTLGPFFIITYVLLFGFNLFETLLFDNLFEKSFETDLVSDPSCGEGLLPTDVSVTETLAGHMKVV